MIPVIEARRAQITSLCRQYHVRRLEVFGSGELDRGDATERDALCL